MGKLATKMTTFYIHGPKTINGTEVWAITEGEKSNNVWALCPTKEYADIIAGLLEIRFIKETWKRGTNTQDDFDKRFKDSWENVPFNLCVDCKYSPWCKVKQECQWQVFNHY